VSTFFHPPDSHAGFDHEIIITPVRMVRVNGQFEMVGGDEFIICSTCGHWVDRPMVGKCRCPASCHAEARSVYTSAEL
jgi:hypothetical protein